MTIPDDWTFVYKDTGEEWDKWFLQTDEYVSSPSSFCPDATFGGNYTGMAILTKAGLTHLPEGRVITQAMKLSGLNNHWLDLGVNPTTRENQIQYEIPLTTYWRKWRFSWWYTYDYQNNPDKTRLRVEYWDVDHWQQVYQNDFDGLVGSNLHIAFDCNGEYGESVRIDDTEVWA